MFELWSIDCDSSRKTKWYLNLAARRRYLFVRLLVRLLSYSVVCGCLQSEAYETLIHIQFIFILFIGYSSLLSKLFLFAWRKKTNLIMDHWMNNTKDNSFAFFPHNTYKKTHFLFPIKNQVLFFSINYTQQEKILLYNQHLSFSFFSRNLFKVLIEWRITTIIVIFAAAAGSATRMILYKCEWNNKPNSDCIWFFRVILH